MRKRVGLCLGVCVILAASGCGGGGTGGPIVGDAARGKALYNQATLGKKSAEGCVSCHKYDESKGDQKKAPFTKGTYARAGTRVPGMSADEYLKESILTPDAFVVESYKKGDMYQKWAQDLSEQEIADLIAYLQTEK